MQNPITAERGIQLTGLFCTFSMFFVTRDPIRFSWIIAIFSCVMLYFAIRKFKDDKQTNHGTDKARGIIILACSAVLISSLCAFAYFFID